jgi:hypothetical protein
MMFKQIGSGRMLIGILVLLGLSCGAFYLRKAVIAPTKTVVLARVDLQAAFKNHPNWDRYLELQTQIDKLRRKWNSKNAAAQDAATDSGSNNIKELNKQVNEIEQIYIDESRLKLDNLNNTIKEYVQNRTAQLTAILKERFNNINNQLTKELQNQAQDNETKLQAYLNQLQNDNQVALANLQLQLSLLDISGDSVRTKIEKTKIQKEIDSIKQAIEQKKVDREAALQAEFQVYADNKKKEASAEFGQFKAEKEGQVQADILAYRQKLEHNYLNWKTVREQKLDSARKLRQDKLDQEYRQDKARETILQSQQAQLKEVAVWDIRQKVKQIAQRQKVDCVLAGEFINLNVRDLTILVNKSLLR